MKKIKFNKIILYLAFILFVIDRHIDGEKTEYNTWIIIFLYIIAYNLIELINKK